MVRLRAVDRILIDTSASLKKSDHKLDNEDFKVMDMGRYSNPEFILILYKHQINQ